MKIFRIVTARNTSFMLGDKFDNSLDSPVLIEISWSLEDGWHVVFSNDAIVNIHDPVEFWKTNE